MGRKKTNKQMPRGLWADSRMEGDDDYHSPLDKPKQITAGLEFALITEAELIINPDEMDKDGYSDDGEDQMMVPAQPEPPRKNSDEPDLKKVNYGKAQKKKIPATHQEPEEFDLWKYAETQLAENSKLKSKSC